MTRQQSDVTSRMRTAWAGAACAVLALVAGCGDNEKGATAAPDAAPAPGERYMGNVAVNTPGSDWASYTALLRSVDEATNETLRAGLETPGYVIPSSYGGAIYVPGTDASTIARYTRDAAGGLVQSGRISFAGLGVTGIFRGPTPGANLVSAEKAYLFDDANRRIVIWNPTTMELTGREIDLEAALSGPVAGQPRFVPATFGDFGRLRGDRLFVPVRWADWQAAPPAASFLPSAGMLIIDTTRDAVVGLLTDDRLADSIYTVMSDAGDIYLFTGALGVSHQHVHGNARPGGVLRIPSGQETFDPGYYVNLDAAVGNRPASTPVWVGGASVYMKVFHAERQPIDDELRANPNGLIGKEAWRYWKVDLAGGTPPSEVTDLPWTSTNGFFYELPDEGRRFIGVMSADFADTTLYEVTPTGFLRSIDVDGVLTALSPLGQS
jgi:hypothetical protein